MPGLISGGAGTLTKSETAFRTIGELAEELNLPQHILRYWETRFPQLRPLQRAGNRRYYRPEDVTLARRIDRLLNHEGYTIKGVQKVLAERAPEAEVASSQATIPIAELKRIREMLAEALEEDAA
jgi:DNA-binding transcriptional MerR regulator